MFDISFLEVVVICVITLLVVGPERLPGLVRDVGRWMRKIRRVLVETQYDLEREFNFEEERQRLKKESLKLTSALEEEKQQLKKEGRTLSGAMDQLDDLMKIAPDREPGAAPGKDQDKPIEPAAGGDAGQRDKDGTSG